MRISIILTCLLASFELSAQTSDQQTIKEIFDQALSKGKSYEMLHDLCVNIGPRLSGSPGAAAAVEWSRHKMEDLGFDSVWLQPVMVPHWVRGQQEVGRIINSKKIGTREVAIDLMSLKTRDMGGYHEIAAADYVVVVMRLLKSNGAKNIAC